MKALVVAAAATLVIAGASYAAPRAVDAEPQASIPFVNHGGIRTWHAADAETLYVQDNRRRWYRATLFAPCLDLTFAHTIGFETRGVDRFDRFSTVRVGDDRCAVSSLTPSDAPPPRGKRGRS